MSGAKESTKSVFDGADSAGEVMAMGGALGAFLMIMSHAYGVLMIPICGAIGRESTYACAAIGTLAAYGMALQLPISGNPVVDSLVPWTVLGAAVGAGAYGLFGDSTNEAMERAPDSTKRFSPA